MIECTVFFDIETLPTRDQGLIDEIASGIKTPAEAKKSAAKLDTWETVDRPLKVVEAVGKTALDGGVGHLAAIGMCVGDREIQCELALEEDGTHTVGAERWLIECFFRACEEVHDEYGVPPIMCAHNAIGFDVRWLWKRSMVLGIEVPWWWPVDARPWDQDRVVDTQVLWEGPKGFIRLDTLARRLGIAGKAGGMDGSQVAAVWAAGDYERVRTYCADDVRVLRDVYRRLTGHTVSRPKKAKRPDRAPPEIEAPPVDASSEHEEFGVCF